MAQKKSKKQSAEDVIKEFRIEELQKKIEEKTISEKEIKAILTLYKELRPKRAKKTFEKFLKKLLWKETFEVVNATHNLAVKGNASAQKLWFDILERFGVLLHPRLYTRTKK